MNAQLFSITILILAVACVSDSMPPQAPEDRPPFILKDLPKELKTSVGEGRLRHGETLKAYSIGRRLDSVDETLMYEGGIVYRLESESSWNLQPSLPKNTPFAGQGPESIRDNEGALKAEFEVKTHKLRTLYRSLKKSSEEAAVQVNDLKDKSKISQKLLVQNKELSQKLSQSQKENSQLQAQLGKLKEQIQALLKFYQKKQEEQIKTKFRRQP